MALMGDWSRRGLLLGSAGLVFAGCGKKAKDEPAASAPATAKASDALAAAIAGDWRSQTDKARDPWRHPRQSLEFWGLRPGITVVEFWPGAGWYTDILAPYLNSTGGRLYAAHLQTDNPNDPTAGEIVQAFRNKLASRPRVYGKVEVTAFGPTSGPVAPAGGADLVLFLRNIHNWMAAGVAEKAFRDAFAALKPGGALGVEEHRADPGGVQEALAADGYVQQAYVTQLAKEAGFTLAEASEVNANPKDTRDHPFGVWTLPPTRLSAPRGEPAEAGFDHSKYDAIGESDRMTLKFVKPS